MHKITKTILYLWDYSKNKNATAFGFNQECTYAKIMPSSHNDNTSSIENTESSKQNNYAKLIFSGEMIESRTKHSTPDWKHIFNWNSMKPFVHMDLYCI